MAQVTLFPLTRQFWHWYVSTTNGLLYTIGIAVIEAKTVFQFLIRGKLSPKLWISQAAFIGVDALGISLLLTLFSGMVIALQIAQELSRQGAGNFVGALVSLSILRELAPIMTGFSVIAMVGSAYCAELATMNINQQIDALRVLHVNPSRYLVLPRLMAAMTMLPLMTILTATAGIIGGMMVSYLIGDLNPSTFLDSVWRYTKTKDLLGALLKSTVFGFLIVLFSTSIGINTRGGAKDVGISTTNAVVWSFIAMAIADYAMSAMMFGDSD